MNAVRCLVRSQVSRSINTSAVLRKDLTKLKEKQRMFQLDETVPVYLKRGAADRVVFAFLALGVAGGVIMSADVVRRLVFPPPPS